MNSRQAVGNIPVILRGSHVLENNPHVKQLVVEDFDPRNRDHMVAFLCINRYGKQHPTMRFKLEHPYTSIKAMMDAKVADAYTDLFHALDDEALISLGKPVTPEPTAHANVTLLHPR